MRKLLTVAKAALIAIAISGSAAPVALAHGPVYQTTTYYTDMSETQQTGVRTRYCDGHVTFVGDFGDWHTNEFFICP